MQFQTDEFRIPRYLLARVSAEEYVRSLWWFVLPVPLFGIAALFSGSGVIQAVGILAILWPLTIPARALLAAWKAGTFFERGVRLEGIGDLLLFHGKDGKGMRLHRSQVRAVYARNGFVILRFGVGDLVAVPVSAVGTNLDQLLGNESG